SDNQRNARYRQRTGHTGDHVTDDAETENDKRADWDARVTGFRSTRRNQPPRRKAENQRLNREHPEQQTPITVLGENSAQQRTKQRRDAPDTGNRAQHAPPMRPAPTPCNVRPTRKSAMEGATALIAQPIR